MIALMQRALLISTLFDTGGVVVNGPEKRRAHFPVVPARFSVTETFDVGRDVGEAFYENARFPFTGKLEQVTTIDQLNLETGTKTSKAEQTAGMDAQSADSATRVIRNWG